MTAGLYQRRHGVDKTATYDLRLPSQQLFRLRWAAKKGRNQQTIKELANTCEHQQIKAHTSDCEHSYALGAHHGLRGGHLPA
eukprot:4078658-Pleurochrysis_carterae.AAC.2